MNHLLPLMSRFHPFAMFTKLAMHDFIIGSIGVHCTLVCTVYCVCVMCFDDVLSPLVAPVFPLLCLSVVVNSQCLVGLTNILHRLTLIAIKETHVLRLLKQPPLKFSIDRSLTRLYVHAIASVTVHVL